MSIGNTCGKCEAGLFEKSEKKIICAICKRFFHKRCSKLDDSALKVLDLNGSCISWYCPSCNLLPWAELTNRLSEFSKEFSSLRSEIGDLKNQVLNISPAVSMISKSSNNKTATRNSLSESSVSVGGSAVVIQRPASVSKISNPNFGKPAAGSSLSESSDFAGGTAVTVQRPTSVMKSSTKFATSESSGSAGGLTITAQRPASVMATDSSVNRASGSLSTGISSAPSQHIQNSGCASEKVPQNIQSPMLSNDILSSHTSKQPEEWITVQRKKRPGALKIVGSAAACDLEVVNNTRWLHVSRLHPNTQEESLLNYVASRLIISPDQLKCKRLVKQDADISMMKFITFKLGVPEHIVSRLMTADLWPSGVVVRRFKHLQKNGIPLTSESKER